MKLGSRETRGERSPRAAPCGIPSPVREYSQARSLRRPPLNFPSRQFRFRGICRYGFLRVSFHHGKKGFRVRRIIPRNRLICLRTRRGARTRAALSGQGQKRKDRRGNAARGISPRTCSGWPGWARASCASSRPPYNDYFSVISRWYSWSDLTPPFPLLAALMPLTAASAAARVVM